MIKKFGILLLSISLVLGMNPLFYVRAADYSLGDVNSDGKVSATDASDVLCYYSAISTGGKTIFTDIQQTAADVNGDGLIDAIDASVILAYYAYISTSQFKSLSDYIIDGSSSCNPYINNYASKTYLLYCADEEKLISYHDIHRRIAPASLTKLLTAAVVLKHMNTDTVVTVGSEPRLAAKDSSLCLISAGQKLTVYDLLTGMLMASGNDAAYTAAVVTARSVAGSTMTDNEAVEYFCGLMNDYASELGMNESCFTNPDGYDSNDCYTSAADMLKLARYCLSVPEIMAITGKNTKKVTIRSGQIFNWKNTNCLLDSKSAYYCTEAIGMKTGTTADAGTCLIAAFRKNGKTYIALVLGCPDDEARYGLTTELIDFCK